MLGKFQTIGDFTDSRFCPDIGAFIADRRHFNFSGPGEVGNWSEAIYTEDW